jgi:hypothetical protein
MGRLLKPLGAALLCALTASHAAGGEQAHAELPAVEWTGMAVNLEDLKGQVVVVVFYNDDLS